MRRPSGRESEDVTPGAGVVGGDDAAPAAVEGVEPVHLPHPDLVRRARDDRAETPEARSRDPSATAARAPDLEQQRVAIDSTLGADHRGDAWSDGRSRSQDLPRTGPTTAGLANANDPSPWNRRTAERKLHRCQQPNPVQPVLGVLARLTAPRNSDCSVCAARWSTRSPSTRPTHPRSAAGQRDGTCRASSAALQPVTAGLCRDCASRTSGSAARTRSSTPLASRCASASACGSRPSVRNRRDRRRCGDTVSRDSRPVTERTINSIARILQHLRCRGRPGERLDVGAAAGVELGLVARRSPPCRRGRRRRAQRATAGRREAPGERPRYSGSPSSAPSGCAPPGHRAPSPPRAHPLAQHPLFLAGLDVDDSVRARQGALESLLDVIGDRVTLPDGRAREDADHDVDERLAARLPQPKAAELDERIERLDRGAGDLDRRVRRPIPSARPRSPDQPGRGEQDEHRDEQRGDRVAPCGKPRSRRSARRGRRACRRGRHEVERVREQRGARMATSRLQRRHRPGPVDAVTTATARNAHHAGSTSTSIQPTVGERERRDADADDRRADASASAGEMLGLPVPVLVTGIGRCPTMPTAKNVSGAAGRVLPNSAATTIRPSERRRDPRRA